MTRPLAGAAAALVAACLAGCTDSKYGTVRGKVTLDGQPVSEGVIEFLPLNKDTPTASCYIKDGAYEARVPVTTHKVRLSSVRKVAGGKPNAAPTLDESRFSDAIPAKYNTQSDLTLEVKPGEAEHNFELKK